MGKPWASIWKRQYSWHSALTNQGSMACFTNSFNFPPSLPKKWLWPPWQICNSMPTIQMTGSVTVKKPTAQHRARTHDNTHFQWVTLIWGSTDQYRKLTINKFCKQKKGVYFFHWWKVTNLQTLKNCLVYGIKERGYEVAFWHTHIPSDSLQIHDGLGPNLQNIWQFIIRLSNIYRKIDLR